MLSSGVEPQLAHPPRVLVGEAGQHPTHLGQVGTRAVAAAHEQAGQGITFDGHAL